MGRVLDNEVVRTQVKNWRDLKMGIAGSAKVLSMPTGKDKRQGGVEGGAANQSEGFNVVAGMEYETNDCGNKYSEGGPPPNPFLTDVPSLDESQDVPPPESSSAEMAAEVTDTPTGNKDDNDLSSATLRLMQMCDNLEGGEVATSVATENLTKGKETKRRKLRPKV